MQVLRNAKKTLSHTKRRLSYKIKDLTHRLDWDERFEYAKYNLEYNRERIGKNSYRETLTPQKEHNRPYDGQLISEISRSGKAKARLWDASYTWGKYFKAHFNHRALEAIDPRSGNYGTPTLETVAYQCATDSMMRYTGRLVEGAENLYGAGDDLLDFVHAKLGLVDAPFPQYADNPWQKENDIIFNHLQPDEFCGIPTNTEWSKVSPELQKKIAKTALADETLQIYLTENTSFIKPYFFTEQAIEEHRNEKGIFASRDYQKKADPEQFAEYVKQLYDNIYEPGNMDPAADAWLYAYNLMDYLTGTARIAVMQHARELEKEGIDVASLMGTEVNLGMAENHDIIQNDLLQYGFPQEELLYQATQRRTIKINLDMTLDEFKDHLDKNGMDPSKPISFSQKDLNQNTSDDSNTKDNSKDNEMQR